MENKKCIQKKYNKGWKREEEKEEDIEKIKKRKYTLTSISSAIIGLLI